MYNLRKTKEVYWFHIVLMILIFNVQFHGITQGNMRPVIEDCFLQKHEKVFVQLNKYNFVSGERIFFKAYILNGASIKPQSHSKVLYFELINKDNKRVHYWKSKIQNSNSAGYTLLPDSLSLGSYLLRAYTSWMRNLPPIYSFHTDVVITGFEGGYPPYINQPFIEFSRPDNPAKQHDLLISLRKENNQDIIVITGKKEFPQMNDIYLMVMQRGACVYRENISYSEKQYECTLFLPEGLLKRGVYNFILLNNKQEIMLQMPVVYYKPYHENIHIETEREIYHPGENIKIQLSVHGLKNGEYANLSMSVYSVCPLGVNQNRDIVKYVLYNSELPELQLNSELSQHASVYNTQDAFISDSPYLYKINESATTRPCKYISENQGMVLKGRITNRETGKKMSNSLVLLAFPDSVHYLEYCYTNNNGAFFFLLDSMYAEKQLILQIQNSTTPISWEIDKKSPELSLKNNKINISHKTKEYLTEQQKLFLARRIYNGEEGVSEIIKKHTSNTRIHFYGKPDYIIHPSEYAGLDNFQEIADNILPGVRMRKRDDRVTLQLADPVNNISLPPNALLLLNGIPFFDLGYIMNLPSHKIETIGVCLSQIHYGDLSFEGIVTVQTNDVHLPGSYTSRNSVFTYFNEGYANDGYNARTFNSTNSQGNLNVVSEFKSNVLWIPDMTIKPGHTEQFVTKAPLYKGEYMINIQGVTQDGLLVNETKKIDIK